MNRVEASPGSQPGREEKGDWCNRLRLRRATSHSFFTEPNIVKTESNVTADKEEQLMGNCVQISNRFLCSSCSDGIYFRPEELMMHYMNVHGGKGNPPIFPCNLCGFSSTTFTMLQKHRRKHKESVFTCDICEDNVKRTMTELIKHCKMEHSLNGRYYCLKCKLSIQEIEEFACHLCLPPIKNEESITNKKFDSPVKNEPLMVAECRQRWNRRSWWKKRATSHMEDNKASQDFKMLLPQPESSLSPLSTPGLLDNHDVLLDQEIILKKTKQFLERTTGCGKKEPVQNELNHVFSASNNQENPSLKSVGNEKVAGLMERNNISVPSDCTTKVVGFKIVDGKKHLVIKVIPSIKRDNVSTRSETLKPANQTLSKLSDVSAVNNSGKCSHAQVKPDMAESQKQKPECVAQHDFWISVVERMKNIQQNDQELAFKANHSLNLNSALSEKAELKARQSCTGTVHQRSCTKTGKKPKNQHPCTRKDFQSTLLTRWKKLNDLQHDSESPPSKRLKNLDYPIPCSDATSPLVKTCPEKAFIEPEETFSTWQADSGFHSDLTSETPSLEEKCPLQIEKELILGANTDLCSAVSFERINLSSRSPLTLSGSLCRFQCEDKALLFHSSPNDECTNNSDPRDLLVPLGHDQTLCVPMEHALPLTTVTHLLDEVREGHALASTHSSAEVPRRVETCSAEASSSPIASINTTISQETVRESQKSAENITASTVHWEPSPRDSVKTLRLTPFSSSVSLQTLRGIQPLIVLNHPDSEIPEVTNIMRLIHKHKFTVEKVVLSRKTLKALSESDCNSFGKNMASSCRREWPMESVKEQFCLKLKLKRVCGRKYSVVPVEPKIVIPQPKFRCWFCGRIFRNQEAWIGHGQRHLMEATRGWNQLFSS